MRKGRKKKTSLTLVWKILRNFEKIKKISTFGFLGDARKLQFLVRHLVVRWILLVAIEFQILVK